MSNTGARRFVIAITFLACVEAARSAGAAPAADGTLVQFNDNGAWCWFQDERTIIDPNTHQLLIASIASGDGVGGAARDGNADVTSYNLDTGATSRFTLIDWTYTADEHFTPALILRPDGKYLAVYAAHQNDSLIRWRVSTNPGDATDWTPEQSLTVTSNQGTTYSNLFYLTSTSKLYDFYRGNNYDPHLLTSTNQGSSFSYTGHLLMDPGNSSGQRPYVKYASNGNDRIYFITTQAHPRDMNTGIYAGYMTTDGHLHQLNGTDVGSLGTNSGTVTSATAFTTILAPNQVVNGTPRTRAWTTDLALDSGGNPYMLFTSRVNDDDTDHRFYYARWDGDAFKMTELAKAGAYLYKSENDYTGLGALDPDDPNTLYISTKIDPRDGTTTASKYEIYRGFTNNDGSNWTWTPITIDSASDNLRPIMPKWGSTHSALLWFRGNYSTYQHFDTAVVGKFYSGANGVFTKPTGGAWDDGGNWREGRVASGLSNIADFSTLDYAGNVNVTNATPRTLGFITSGDADPGSSSNLIISGSTITLDGGVISPQINVISQTTTIESPLAGAQGLLKLGDGTLVLGAANTYTGATQVDAGTLIVAHSDALHGGLSLTKESAVRLAPSLPQPVVLDSLNFQDRGQLDLTNNSLVIDYASSSGSPIDQVRQDIVTGRINSSDSDAAHRIGYADNATLGLGSFGGRPVDATSILIRYTYGGDANLDGKVDVADLGALASHWQTVSTWTGGDFNDDGTVDVTDLGILASNWQAGTNSPSGRSLNQLLTSLGVDGVAVPEPAALGPLILSFAAAARAPHAGH